MTLQELTNNMTSNYCKSSNYYRLVQQQAYEDMLQQHYWCDFYKNIKEQLKAQNKTAAVDNHGKRITIYNKQHKLITFTIYSKVPRYRTYKHQLGITTYTLYKQLLNKLYNKDKNKIIRRCATCIEL